MTYDQVDIDAFLREHPRFVAPALVRGPRLTFRQATPDDAEFILSLRLDTSKNQHLSAVPDDVSAQRNYIASLGKDQLYFIIEAAERPVGTVRLYDQRGTSFSWGSWILTDDAPKSSAVESTLMVYSLGLELGFKAAHFQVRKGNEKVWQYHERFGAKRVGETDDEFHYSIDKSAILNAFERYMDRGRTIIEW